MICVFFAAASISLARAGSRSGCRLRLIGSGQNFFVGRIPAQHASETVTVYGHAAGHRDAEGKVKRAVRLIAGAHAVQKVLDVRNVEGLLSLIDRPPQNLGPFWPGDLLRQAPQLTAPT